MRVPVACLALLMSTMNLTAQTTLAGLRDSARPLLIFAGPHDDRVEQQYATLADHAQAARDRDMKVLLLTTSRTRMHDGSAPPGVSVSPQEAAHLRTRFHVAPDEFTVILIGKDGGEKLRSHQPIPWETLAQTIDAMPMRQQETRHR